MSLSFFSNKTACACVVLIILTASPLINFAQIKGIVVSIADGDTFTLLDSENKQIKIRLHGIDCPERAQDFGQVAKQYLSDLIFRKPVSVTQTDIDRYGRTIGIVYIDTININERILLSGLAWHYKRYDSNPVWSKLEQTAKENKKGLWSKNDPVPPWEFRKLKTAQ